MNRDKYQSENITNSTGDSRFRKNKSNEFQNA